MGATLVPGGATFRVWAPRAAEVYILGDFNSWAKDRLVAAGSERRRTMDRFHAWRRRRRQYKFYVVGDGHRGLQARSLCARADHRLAESGLHRCVRAATFPWQDWSWRTPDFRDLIVYQFHVGTLFGPNRESRVAKFLDVLDRLEYLADLGVNAIEPLPIVEYSTPRSLGYNGSDLFSPEMDYQVAGRASSIAISRS